MSSFPSCCRPIHGDGRPSARAAASQVIVGRTRRRSRPPGARLPPCTRRGQPQDERRAVLRHVGCVGPRRRGWHPPGRTLFPAACPSATNGPWHAFCAGRGPRETLGHGAFDGRTGRAALGMSRMAVLGLATATHLGTAAPCGTTDRPVPFRTLCSRARTRIVGMLGLSTTETSGCARSLWRPIRRTSRRGCLLMRARRSCLVVR